MTIFKKFYTFEKIMIFSNVLIIAATIINHMKKQ